ncbi:MAG: M28 family peptidase [Thermoanaerobaculia bacterium]
MIRKPGARLAVAAALSALFFAAGLARDRASRPVPANAPAQTFSAERARGVLREVLEPESPHPQGSAASARVEGRILSVLSAAGYSPVVREAFACGGYGTCGTVRNILARLPGRDERGAVVLSAHSDSVEAGPGASDDGLGVACVLEIARILRSRPAARRPVLFLIDDGEEQGLLGAEAFAATARADDVSAVVNLEARGTSGASLLFETSPGNRWLIDAAKAIPHPVSSSVFPAIYRMLPNDTDLTVFERRGMAGVNFACVGGVAHYHTPLDDLAHLNLSTLQHEGENALAMVESLASRDAAAAKPRGDAVFFDLLGAVILSWPDSWTMPIAAVSILLLAAGLIAMGRRSAFRFSEGLLALASFWGMVAAAALASSAARGVLKAGGIVPSAWTAHPVAPLVGLWLVSLAALGGIAVFASRRAGPAALSAGIWSGWAILAMAAAFALPGVSFLFLLPLLAATWSPAALDPESLAGVMAPPLAALLWLPMAWRLWDAIGFDGIAVIGAAVAIPATALVPAAARLGARAQKSLLAAIASGAALFLFASIGLAPYSADSPERLTIFWHQDADSATASWILDGAPVPKELSKAANFGSTPVSPYPWSSMRALEAPAPRENLAPPEFRLEERSQSGGRLRFRGRIVSPRGARSARISFPPAIRVEKLTIGGTAVAPLSGRALSRSNGWKSYACVTLPAEGIEVEGELAGDSPAFVLMDRTPGLPPSGRPLLAARPATAVPSQTGDASIITRRISL